MSIKLKAIKDRVVGIGQLNKVVRAMYLLAAAFLPKSRRKNARLCEHVEHVDACLQALLLSRDVLEGDAFIYGHPSAGNLPLALVAIGTSRGLCGGVNARVLKVCREKLANHGRVHIYAVGKKLCNDLRNMTSDLENYDLTSEDMRSLSAKLMADYVAGKIGAIKVVYLKYFSVFNQQAEISHLLPLCDGNVYKHAFLSDKLKQKRWGTVHMLPSQEGCMEVFMQYFLLGHLFMLMSSAVLSETAARMISMEGACKQCKDILRDLNLKYCAERQSVITTELCSLSVNIDMGREDV